MASKMKPDLDFYPNREERLQMYKKRILLVKNHFRSATNKWLIIAIIPAYKLIF